MDRSLLASLQDAVAGPVAVGPEALESASRDASAVRGRAEAVVRPADREDTVALVGWARSHRVALTARGGGTSLDGESVPVEGGVVVDFSGWTALGTVDLAARTIRVGPGVVNRDLHETLRP
ncbi:MAG TPA: FAD-binding protein, partial [Thermoplasmata archaeon]|nr:FAD-binding protein [Thermoplasmata archaeon]